MPWPQVAHQDASRHHEYLGFTDAGEAADWSRLKLRFSLACPVVNCPGYSSLLESASGGGGGFAYFRESEIFW